MTTNRAEGWEEILPWKWVVFSPNSSGIPNDDERLSYNKAIDDCHNNLLKAESEGKICRNVPTVLEIAEILNNKLSVLISAKSIYDVSTDVHARLVGKKEG